MKRTLLAMSLFTALFADDIERINSLVSEVKSLRQNYEQCTRRLSECVSKKSDVLSDGFLKECELDLQKERARNLELVKKIEKRSCVKQQQEVKYLESQINEYKRRLQAKEKQLQQQKRKNAALQKELAKIKDNLKKQINKRKTSEKSTKKALPKVKKNPQKRAEKLKTSPEVSILLCNAQSAHVRQHLALEKNGNVRIVESDAVVKTKPKTFKTSVDAYIYDAKNGKKLFVWERGTSFTSYLESGSWIKITGYFVERKWTKAKKEMWIRKADAIQKR